MYLRSLNSKVLMFVVVVVGALVVVTLYSSMPTNTITYPHRHDAHTPHVSGAADQEAPMESVTNTTATIATTTTTATATTTTTDARSMKRVYSQMKAAFFLYRKLITDPLEYSCEKVKYIKNVGEGSWRYCDDANFTIRQPCLVYSFGINYDFTFEDVSAQMGCDVFSFDPSMAMPDHRRGERVMFYGIGLGSEDTDSYVPHLDMYVRRNTVWKMRTLGTLLKELGHANRTVDLLKIDIESSEWSTVANMLKSGVFKQVKQFLVEWHIFPAYPDRSEFESFVTLLDKLKDVGLRVFDKVPHPWTLRWDRFNLQSDMGYVNANFAKP